MMEMSAVKEYQVRLKLIDLRQYGVVLFKFKFSTSHFYWEGANYQGAVVVIVR
jgi:hypothetical protein